MNKLVINPKLFRSNLLIILIILFSVTLHSVDNFRGNCLDFNGNDNVVEMYPFTEFPQSELSLSLYVRPLNSYSSIISYAITGADNHFLLWLEPELTVFINQSSLATGIMLEDSVWTHIAVTWQNSDGTLNVYINGTLEFTTTTSVGVNLNDGGSFVMAQEQDSIGTYDPNQAYQGQIDEVRLWNVVRTEEQINDFLYTNLTGTETGLVSYWQFNESAGTTAIDEMGLNDGTLQNMNDDDWVNSTIPFLPYVTTSTATSIAQTTATAGGEVMYEGSSSVNARGVCFSVSPNPTITDSHTTDGTGTGNFTSSLTGLNSVTRYYYRAYASNSVGTYYGDEYFFTTTPAGSGSSNNPYQISNLDALRWLSENNAYWDAFFIQTADINASETQNWNSGNGFSPIGNYSNNFTGNYDGQSYTIDSLFINRPSRDHVGFFGFANQAEFNDLGIINQDFTGLNCVGGLVGSYHSSTTYNCYSTGTTAGETYVGGLIGNNDNSELAESFSTGSVNGEQYLGGLSGSIYNSYTNNCYSTCNIDGVAYTGGLAGKITGLSLNNCYSTGSVTGFYNTGGLIGNNNDSSVNSSFWDIETSGQNGSAGGIGKTTAQMQTKSTFTDAGWDFAGETANGFQDDWILFPDSYPALFFTYGSPPIITAISDVPGDQGRKVNVCWNRCGLDVSSSNHPISGYNLWIEYPFNRSNCDITENIELAITSYSNSDKSILSNPEKNHTPLLYERDDEYWVLVQSIYAMQWESYSVLAQTYQDSATTEDNPSTFFVSAHTTDPGIYISSEIMSGYSVDNIAPNKVSNVNISFNTKKRNSNFTLSWDEVTEGSYQGNSYPELNGIWYKIYASETVDFACDENNYLTTTQNLSIEINDIDAEHFFFKIIASDQE